MTVISKKCLKKENVLFVIMLSLAAADLNIGKKMIKFATEKR